MKTLSFNRMPMVTWPFSLKTVLKKPKRKKLILTGKKNWITRNNKKFESFNNVIGKCANTNKPIYPHQAVFRQQDQPMKPLRDRMVNCTPQVDTLTLECRRPKLPKRL